MADGTEIKDRQKAMWTVGDYPAVAHRIEGAAATAVSGLGVADGHDVLDVATGTGNAALIAAAAGANVTGLDLTPKLIEVARDRAVEAGLDITFVEGDAESLPFDDDSFDRVISVFGVMFAPNQQQGADELARVCRPGGRIGVCAWTPEGINGRMFTALGAHMPPPPEGFQPPVRWGTEDRVRELFSASGAGISFERPKVTFEEESVEGWVTYSEGALGPVVMAKAALEPAGKWDAARSELVAMYEEANEADDDSLRFQAEYLVSLVEVP